VALWPWPIDQGQNSRITRLKKAKKWILGSMTDRAASIHRSGAEFATSRAFPSTNRAAKLANYDIELCVYLFLSFRHQVISRKWVFGSIDIDFSAQAAENV